MSDIACFSFYPTKNLGGLGDGGMCVTNSKELYERIKSLHEYGDCKELGYNSRLDEVQAVILRIKLKKLNTWNMGRRLRAIKYGELFRDSDLPIEWPNADFLGHTFHQYTIRVKEEDRDKLRGCLRENGIETRMYYPYAIHQLDYIKRRGVNRLGPLDQAEKLAKTVLQLPIAGVMTHQVEYIVKVIKKYYKLIV